MSVSDFFSERSLNKRYGIDSPTELWELLLSNKLKEDLGIPEGQLYFRGQANQNYGISPRLYREVYKPLIDAQNQQNKKLTEELMQVAENAMIDEALANGLGRNMSKLELLGLLQHHGIPTRLLDVTTDILPALYFAVEKHGATNGRLFIFSVKQKPLATSKKDVPWFFPRSKELPWRNLTNKRDSWSNAVYQTRPLNLDARMIAQNATFLVGGLNSSGGEFPQYRKGHRTSIPAAQIREITTMNICFPQTKRIPSEFGKWQAYGWNIEIPATWKQDLRNFLENHNNPIHADSIYPPINEAKRLITKTGLMAIDKKNNL